MLALHHGVAVRGGIPEVDPAIPTSLEALKCNATPSLKEVACEVLKMGII